MIERICMYCATMKRISILVFISAHVLSLEDISQISNTVQQNHSDVSLGNQLFINKLK
jgi:uncharacterized membrane protein